MAGTDIQRGAAQRVRSALINVARVTAVASMLTGGAVRAQAPGAAATNGSVARSWVQERWTVQNGLPVNSINRIIQDRAGYMWAATFDGLVRFDGVRFTVFNSSNSEGLPSNRIVELQEGRDGGLWLTTEQGHFVRFRDGQFTNIPYEGALAAGGLSTLLEDRAGVLWVGTPAGLWRENDGRLRRVGASELDARVTALMQGRDGRLCAALMGKGIHCLGADERISKYPSDSALDGDLIVAIIEDSSGTFWAAGTQALWSGRDRLTRVKTPTQPFWVQQFAQVPATRALFVATSDAVYELSEGGMRQIRPTTPGIHLWTDSTSLWSVNGREISRDGRHVMTMDAGRVVMDAVFDREGSLWLATESGGLYRLKPALFESFSVPEGVAHRNVYATYVGRTGTVWIGTWGGGTSRLDPETGRATPLTHPVLPTAVNSFYEDASGVLWIAGAEAQSGVYSCTPGLTACRLESPPELRQRAVFALHGDSNGALWAGAAGLLLRRDGNAWTSFPSSTGAPDATVRAFASTPDGALWMGTNGGGLARYHDGAFKRVTHAHGLPSDLVRSLYVDADGWLWVGTEGRGLARLDPRAFPAAGTVPRDAIVRIGARDGLFDEVIHQILEDNFGRLWMNTNRGIFWVPRAELIAFAEKRVTRIHSTAYTERDGLRNREGNGGVQPAGAKAPDGRLWFPTQDGVVVVDPARVRRERLAPALVVERLLSGGEALRPDGDTISLHPSQRDVQIEYTALTFLEPANVRFRYRLDPYDSNWVDVGSRRTAFYTKVPPGRYTFRVEASDAAGGWHEPGTSLAVRVLPRAWETGLFQGLATLSLGVLLVVAVRLREARLRARALTLERTVNERTAALRDRERELADRNVQLQSLDHAKSRFFANVSHELRTPLTLTIGPLEDLRARAGGDPQVERWLDIALRSARRLLRLVNQILDVAKLEAGAMHLVPRQMDLVPFARGIVGAFTPVAERRGIQLTMHADDAIPGAFDADAIEKILTNLLSNAMKFTPTGGTVHLDALLDLGAAKLVVSDSGPGIPADQLAHVFERFYQVDESTTRSQPGTGIGLSLVKELVELHGGSIAVASGEVGTTFSATIPSLVSAGAAQLPLDASGRTAPIRLASGEQPAALLQTPATGDRGEDTPTLLVVDDSADLRSYIRDHFASRFRVLEAADGAEGIALATRHLPDVILSDVMMPGTDGNELVRVLRESAETDFLCIVLLTAQAEDEQRLAGLERGADDYLVKPFEMRELDVRVRNLITARRRLRIRFAKPAREPRPPAPGAPQADEAYAAAVREAVRQSLSDPDFGVAELADAVAQDRSHLFRRVKLAFGESPSDLIKRMRLEEAERLLVEGSGTVTDVAYAVGFNSLSYFCRCFQEAYGSTPATYRTRMTKAGG